MKQQTTSWGAVADWYDGHLQGDDTYHAKVVAPNLVRIVAPKGKKIVEVGCGEGYFSRLFAEAGGEVDASDISLELIASAKRKGGERLRYFTTPADKLPFAEAERYDTAVAVLTLQNMESLAPVMREIARVLKPKGKFVFVLNHPTFRIPKESSWVYDDASKKQYRRVDAYMTSSKVAIAMHPGMGSAGADTFSFHHSLQEYSKILSNNGFAIARIEEWISHKVSGSGPRKEAEDRARREFPLFMCVEAVKL